MGLYKDIRLKRCMPDTTRSGRWVSEDAVFNTGGLELGGYMCKCQSCSAAVHTACLVKCTKFHKTCCRPCVSGWAHRCGVGGFDPAMLALGGTPKGEGEEEDGELVTDAESSSAGTTDAEDVESAAVNLFGNDRATQQEMPEDGLIFNIARFTVSRAHPEGARSCCGWTFRRAAARHMNEWPDRAYQLCRKGGCFVECFQ